MKDKIIPFQRKTEVDLSESISNSHKKEPQPSSSNQQFETRGQETLKGFLKSKKLEKKDYRKALQLADTLKRNKDDHVWRETVEYQSYKDNLKDLNLTDSEVAHAVDILEHERESSRKKQKKILIIAASITIFFVSYFSMKYYGVKTLVSDAMTQVQLVGLQQKRAQDIILQLNTLIQNREDFKFDKFKKIIKTNDIKAVNAALPELSRLLNDEAFFKLMDEVTGGYNRLTVAKRRYLIYLGNFKASLGLIDQFFLNTFFSTEKEKIAAKELLQINELKTGK